MKRLLIPVIILGTYACSNNRKSDVTVLNFSEVSEQAVLIGDEIELLDNNLNVLEKISNLTGRIVDIIGVSDSLFNTSNDVCDAFWYARIEAEDVKGIVNGRQVFRIKESDQDTSFAISSNPIEILTTDFLGMGVEYEGDLVGCSVDQPILIKDKKNKYFGLAHLIQNEYSKMASWDNEYPFFEIRNDDGCYDRIESIVADGSGFKLKIHRSWQEGENDFEVVLNFENNRYNAEYINFGEIKNE